MWAPSAMVVGDNVYIGKFCTIECDGAIGKEVLIANNVGLVGRYDHDYRTVGKTVRTAPWIGDPGYDWAGKHLKIVIQDDVWIGFGAVVLSGVTVGRGAIVGAGAVVHKDVAPYSVVTGNPANKVGMRFSENQIAQHEKMIYGRVVTELQDM